MDAIGEWLASCPRDASTVYARLTHQIKKTFLPPVRTKADGGSVVARLPEQSPLGCHELCVCAREVVSNIWLQQRDHAVDNRQLQTRTKCLTQSDPVPSAGGRRIWSCGRWNSVVRAPIGETRIRLNA